MKEKLYNIAFKLSNWLLLKCMKYKFKNLPNYKYRIYVDCNDIAYDSVSKLWGRVDYRYCEDESIKKFGHPVIFEDTDDKKGIKIACSIKSLPQVLRTMSPNKSTKITSKKEKPNDSKDTTVKKSKRTNSSKGAKSSNSALLSRAKKR